MTTMGAARLAWWLWVTLVVVLFCAPLFGTLDRQDFENDEAIYSFSVDMMLRSGDWLTPKSIPHETVAFLEKPPLKFWIVALPIHWGLLPANEFGMRFWDAAMGSIAFLYVFAIGRRLAGPVCGFVAVWLLFTHAPLVLEHGLRTNNMEAAIFLTYAAGIYHFLAWRTSGPDDRGHIFAIVLYFVLGFMTKFVAALFLPLVLAIAAVLKAEDRFRLRRQWPTFVLAALTAIALIAPWFVYQYLTRGDELLDTMFGAHVLKRFTAHLDPSHLRPWHYYFTEIWRQLQASQAGALVAAGAALVLGRAMRRRWLEGALMVLWFAVPLGLISMGTSKLYHYAYPFLPPIALAGGYAAATAARWLWLALRGPVASLLRLRERGRPRALKSKPVAAALTLLGLASLALAGVTALLGSVRLAVGDVVLLRNSSVFRPLLAGAGALGLGGSPIALRAVVPFALGLALMPTAAYQSVLAQARRDHHPLRDTRACLSRVVSTVVPSGQPPPGVWVEGLGFSHQYAYYLYGLGPWQQRGVASDSTVAMHLFAPNAYRPVMLGAARFAEFTAHLAQDPASIAEKAAVRTELAPEVLQVEFEHADVGVIPWDGATLLLPGPYGVCSAKRLPRSGSR